MVCLHMPQLPQTVNLDSAIPFFTMVLSTIFKVVFFGVGATGVLQANVRATIDNTRNFFIVNSILNDNVRNIQYLICKIE